MKLKIAGLAAALVVLAAPAQARDFDPGQLPAGPASP
jgi:hypothetical protein